MVRILARTRQRNLVAAPTPLGLMPVDFLRPSPSLGRAENNNRPGRALHSRSSPAGLLLRRARANFTDLIHHVIEQLRESAMERRRFLIVETCRKHVRVMPIPAH